MTDERTLTPPSISSAVPQNLGGHFLFRNITQHLEGYARTGIGLEHFK